MSISFKKEGVIGGPLDDEVVKQLNIRKEVISKRTQRSSEDIQYLNSNTGWVKVTSAVDIQSDTDSQSYNSEQARLYQLVGGTAKATKGFSLDENTSYSTSTEYGFVATPGITSFQVAAQGTYGTLRAASFNFTVHSPEDFSLMEQLYLRPGFTVLLEWGHSLYLNDEGVLTSLVNTFPTDRFLRTMSSKDIEKEIKDLKKRNFHNYDALYGFIKNFSWSYNGINYECQVDVVSKGEIIESLRATFSPTFKDTDNSTNTEYSPSSFSSEIELFLTTIVNAPSEKRFLEQDNTAIASGEATLNELRKAYQTLTSRFERKLANVNSRFKVIAASLGGSTFDRKSAWTKYITLRDLLVLFNETSLIYNQNGDPQVEFYVGGDNTSPRFLTFPNHIALDPAICLLPKAKGDLPPISYPIIRQAELGQDEVEDILNIFVSVNYVLSVIKARKENKDSRDNTLYDVVNDIIKAMENTMGGINEFVIHFDEENSLYYIADKKVIPSKEDFERGDDNKPKSYIDLVGLSSEVENLNITSKLSSKLTSMIAIAAQSNVNTDASADILNVQKWNAGLRDRHLTEKYVGNTTVTEPEDTSIDNDAEDKFKKHLRQVDKGNNYYIGYSPDSLESTHRQLMSQYLKKITNEKKTNPPGLIPFELSFTMKGIGGMKIGQAFRVNEFFLPTRYKDAVGFIITGLDHKISNGRWTTDVKTQIFIL